MTASFVSNARFKLALATGEDGAAREDICLAELCQTDLRKVRLQLKTEHELDDEPDCASIMFLRVTNLSLTDHAGHAKGKIAEFLDKRQLGAAQSVSAFYRTLFEEIKRRTNHELEVGSFDLLLKRKAITKTEFQAIIDNLPRPRQFDAIRVEINSLLGQENVAASNILTIFSDWRRLEVERMDRANVTLMNLIEGANQVVDEIRSDGTPRNLSEMLELGLARLGDRPIAGSELFGRTYRMAMLLMKLYEY